MRFGLAALAVAASGAALALPPVGRPKLLQAERHDVSAPLSTLRAAPQEGGEDGQEGEDERGPRPIPLTWKFHPGAADPVLQHHMPFLLMPQIGLNFEGIGLDFLSAPDGVPFKPRGNPPDPQGAVGPSHYVQIVNAGFAIFSKTGTLLLGPVPTRTVFAGFGGPCEKYNDGDGVVVYDKLADRWLISQLTILHRSADDAYTECVAVSRTSDPAGPYARYAYTYETLNDYPKIGAWPDAYYVTYNFFAPPNNTVFRGTGICALDRARMLDGLTARQQCVLVPAGTSGGMEPVDFDGALPPPPGTPGFIVGFNDESLLLYRYHLDWKSPNKSRLEGVELPVAPFSPACSNFGGACIPQAGLTAALLEPLADRMMYRLAYRNLGGHQSLVANHTVTAGKSAGVRWYEVRDPSGDPVLYQQGTYAPDDAWRWMASATMDRAGNIGLGYSYSSARSHAGIGFTGRTAAAPLGVMNQGENLALVGVGSQQAGTQQSERWGDYSSLSIDPADDCTFWYTNEHIPADGIANWHTRVLTFQLPGCTPSAFTLWTSPERLTVGQGRTGRFTVSTAALQPAMAGQPLSLSLSPLPVGVTASLGAATVNAGESVTLDIAAAPDAPAGDVSLAVTGTSGAASEKGIATLGVVASDFSLALETRQITVRPSVKTSVLVSTASLFGPGEQVTFSATRVPHDLTLRFHPPTANVGEDVELQLTGESILAAREFQVSIIASTPSVTHTINAHVSAIAAPRAAIIWPTRLENVSGSEQIFASAAPNGNTTIVRLDLYVDDVKVASADHSPATMLWDTTKVDDGSHNLYIRAADAAGNEGVSLEVPVFVWNHNSCGCSSQGGGWEWAGFAGLLFALRSARARRRN